MLAHDVAGEFFAIVVEGARTRGLISNEHFTVDGTLIEAWASLESFRPKDEKSEDRDPPDAPGNPTVNFHGGNALQRNPYVDDRPRGGLARKGGPCRELGIT